MSIDARPERASSRLRATTIARYAAGSVGTGGYATLPGLVLTYFLTDNLGVTALLAGIIVTAAKVWDVVIDPVIGAASDRALARTGHRRGMMVAGAFTLPVFFALTFAVPPAFGPVAGAICVLAAFLATATAFSIFQVPYVALPAELTPSYDERTRLLSWRVIALTAAILLFGAGGPELRRLTGDPVTGYLVMGIVAGLVIGLGMLVASRSDERTPISDPGEPSAATIADSTPGIREQYAAGIATLRRSAPFRSLLATFLLQALATGTMLAGAQYVATWVLHSESAVTLLFVALVGPALIATPLWERLSRRTGKERAFTLASILFLIAATSIAAAIWTPGAWIYASVAVAGIAYAGLQALPMAMLPDVISHDERRHGPGRAGTFTGVWTAGETVGFALGATIVAGVLALTGYVSRVAGEASTQPPGAVTGIVICFSIVPAVLLVLSLLTLSRYRLRRADIDGLPAGE
ncbi:MFS transporter [Microbacterium pseudoresistens]|uniref:Na+/melibiose symporter-like transporter n=1 Tax=Microbacterium pseudoresistens TaxID=640634 RepID=A0A7Y9ETN3_9MICO|nr:MFS transporter [Microbacterium pseudoresistens]NYD53744.1 Na+/melibiose symporter-like transporter [Microbacterium pseudoresistens]